ncbi:hypothetical protein [Gemmatimonas sp.]|uniref:hypothetical protein n=1 Tax=Gemmatimonas sp. TaxID=1962908 RepID=UPI00286EA371|nr:hypothetical protein [Gemmatimonas sp.]
MQQASKAVATAHRDPGGLEMATDRLAADTGRRLDPADRPAHSPKPDHPLLFGFVQAVVHGSKRPIGDVPPSTPQLTQRGGRFSGVDWWPATRPRPQARWLGPIRITFDYLRVDRHVVAHHQSTWDRQPKRVHARAIELIRWMNQQLSKAVAYSSTGNAVVDACHAPFRPLANSMMIIRCDRRETHCGPCAAAFSTTRRRAPQASAAAGQHLSPCPSIFTPVGASIRDQ